jgi:hypothetical protein
MAALHDRLGAPDARPYVACMKINMTNRQLEAEMRARLERDPRIPDPGEIAVLGDGGIVRLRGTVGSFGLQLRTPRASAASMRCWTT